MWLIVRQLLIKTGWQEASSCSEILIEAISIASASLQQRQSISPASFFQCLHLHQSRFPILICNKSAAVECIYLVPFSWLPLPHVFSVQTHEMAEECWRVRLYCRMYFPQNSHFLHENINLTSYFQKQPREVLCKKRCS